MDRFFDDCIEMFRAQPAPIIRFAAVQGDGPIRTFEMTKTNRCQNVYSIAKAFTMTAIGLLYDRGALDPGERITEILKAHLPADTDPRWREATVDMALRHRMGFAGGALDIDALPCRTFGRDFLRCAFSEPPAYDPGTEYRYGDAAYYVLSRVVSEKTGMKLDDYLWRELFWPMDFCELAWSRCPMGYPIGATGLYVTAEDTVKLGMLYRDGGMFRGRRLLSEEWTRLAVRREYSLSYDKTRTVFSKGGMYGQLLLVAPAQQRVVVMQSYGGDTGPLTAFVLAYKT